MPSGAFDDADELDPTGVSSTDLAALFTSLMRADVSGVRPGAVVSTFQSSSSPRSELLLALSDAVNTSGLFDWINADSERRTRSVAIAKALCPSDPAGVHNARAVRFFQQFSEWADFEYKLLIVPGYTPSGQREAVAGVHEVARRRLEMALADHRAGKAPFIFVSGANVYPRGTTVFEGLEMLNALINMGLPPERILVDAFARHTTTNLRNAGRFMRRHGASKALIITKGGGIGGSDFFGQDFYLQNPTISTFHGRCRKELGYEVGELRAAGDGRIEFQPSPHVDRQAFDPLDP